MDIQTTIAHSAEIDLTDALARKAGRLRSAVDYTITELDNLLPFLPDGYNRALIKDLRHYLTETISDIDSKAGK